jgi:hypothetical protein
MKSVKSVSAAIFLLCLILPWSSSPLAQPQTVPFKLYITELWQLDVNQDIGIGVIADFYAKVTINGAELDNKQGGDGACDDETSTGLVVPLRLFRNFDAISDCHVKTPWAFSRQVPVGQPVHVKIQIFDTDTIFDDEADLKVNDGDAIEFDVDPATGKWNGDINWPQNCSRPGLNLGGNNANVCWQASFDSDDDGLLDVWEKFGVDTDNDGVIDQNLPAFGANPLRKDVFVETDYLAAADHSQGPRKDAVDRVVASFANAPVSNPDGTAGVQLHVDVGNLYGTGALVSVVGPAGAVGTYGDFGGGNGIVESGNEIIDAFVSPKGSGVKFGDLETDNFDPNRGLVFRYAIFGRQTNARAAANDCTTGAADPENRRFLVTLGGIDAAGQPCFGTEAGVSVGSSLEQSGTFMHELGETLNLIHRGGLDDIDRKPNYLSVMNVNFQMCGVPTSPGLLPGVCDYARSVARIIPPPLDERSLDECIGISGGLGFGPVDWNRNGVLEGESRCAPISANSRADVNSDGICVAPGNNGVGNTLPQGDDRILFGAVIDGRDRVCNTAAAPGTDDVQVTEVDKTPVQADVLNSADDWARIIYDPLLAARSVGTRVVVLEADANLINDARRDLGSMMAPQITIEQSGAATAKPGDIVNYSTRITNKGSGPAITVLLKQTNPDGNVATSDLGLIIFGSESTESRSFTVPATACPGDFTGAAAALAFKDFPGQDLTASATTPLQILDVSAPAIDLTVSPNILWPPNHKFVEVTATIASRDNCDSNPVVTLLSITSNEPAEGFLGQGDNGPDVEGAALGTDDRTFSLRAERGTGQESTGRIYTITYQVTDNAGNATVKSATVTVPTSNSGQ